MNEAHKFWSETPQPVVSQVWDTHEFRDREAFDYYRDAICAAFMPLRPELDRDRRGAFEARVVSHRFKGGVLNCVAAKSHLVHRGQTEIAASPDACFYVNRQIEGECVIHQGGASVVLRSGDIGLFDGAAGFDLDHGNCRSLKVASLMVPKQVLGKELSAAVGGTVLKLSNHPVYGSLLCETARLFASSVPHMEGRELSRLYSVLLSVTGLAAGSGPGEPAAPGRGDAHFLRITSIIRDNCANEAFGISDCAAAVGLSAGYIRNLFAARDDSFGNFILRQRLKRAAQLLAGPETAHLPVYAVAYAAGFRDASHFGRAFRSAFGLTPLDWRRKSLMKN